MWQKEKFQKDSEKGKRRTNRRGRLPRTNRAGGRMFSRQKIWSKRQTGDRSIKLQIQLASSEREIHYFYKNEFYILILKRY